MKVWTEAYEVIGDGVAIAEEFYRGYDAAISAHRDVANKYGAKGFRPGRDGKIKSLFFDEVPAGFRRIGREGGRHECAPHKGTKIGKDAAAEFASVALVPDQNDLADVFGWTRNMPFDGRAVYHATATRIQLPSVRYLLTYPRELDDGFAPPSTLNLISLGDYQRAFADHNSAVQAKKEAA